MQVSPNIDAEMWVDHYGDALFHFALARVKDRNIAEDLVQETFLAAVQSQDRFKGHSSEKTWLFSILKHKVIDVCLNCPSEAPMRLSTEKLMVEVPQKFARFSPFHTAL